MSKRTGNARIRHTFVGVYTALPSEIQLVRNSDATSHVKTARSDNLEAVHRTATSPEIRLDYVCVFRNLKDAFRQAVSFGRVIATRIVHEPSATRKARIAMMHGCFFHVSGRPTGRPPRPTCDESEAQTAEQRKDIHHRQTPSGPPIPCPQTAAEGRVAC
ncbi:hypothetical protein MRX96_040145 [Rhipicephalus microplus]